MATSTTTGKDCSSCKLIAAAGAGVAALGALYSLYRCRTSSCRSKCGKPFQSKPKFTYFSGRGLGEPSRLLFAEGGVEYEDIRVHSLDQLKSQGVLAYGQVPLLQVDGYNIVQSNAINRFLARSFGLYGTSLLEGALIDELVDGVGDLRLKFNQQVRSQPEEKKEEAKKKFSAEVIPQWIGYFEKILSENQSRNPTSQWSVGVNFSFADIMLFNYVTQLEKDFPGILAQAPRVKSLLYRVSTRPRIAEWIQKRPVTEF